MTEKVRKYRTKHKRCKYCKYFKIVINCYGGDYCYCTAKDKIIEDYFPDMTQVPRCFCQCYEVKDDE